MTAQSERAAIVAWLNDKIKTVRDQIPAYAQTGDFMEAAILDLAVDTLRTVTDAIERGDHIKEQTND